MGRERTWRGGISSDEGVVAKKVINRVSRHIVMLTSPTPCDHPYCEYTVPAGATVFESRWGDSWYCSALCRERHGRLKTQQRRRDDPAVNGLDNDRRMERKYGISVIQWNDLYKLQKGRCPICQQVIAEVKDAHVDHDHSCCSGAKSCGKCIRGLLCSKCNVGIGYFGDDPERMKRAIKYITDGGVQPRSR